MALVVVASSSHGGSRIDSPLFLFMNTLPTIRIQSSYLFEERFNMRPITKKEIKEYTVAWKKHEAVLLLAMQNVTGLYFAQNIIDVYVVNPDMIGGLSDPLIIGGGMTPQRFICVLAHELVHRLMFDNTKKVDWHKSAWKIWKKEEHLVAHHVVVHAILEQICLDASLVKMLSEDKEIAARSKNAYNQAWEIVKKEGYKNIIAKLKSYK